MLSPPVLHSRWLVLDILEVWPMNMADDNPEFDVDGVLFLALSDPDRLAGLHEQLELFERRVAVGVGLDAIEALDSARCVLVDAHLLDDLPPGGVIAPGPTPVVVLSEDASLQRRMAALQAGAQGFVQLPADASALVARVARLVPNHDVEPLRVFALDDDEDICELYRHFLHGENFLLRTFTRPEAMFEALASQTPDLFLVDHFLPTCSGHDVARMIRQDHAFVGVPIIFVSGAGDEDVFFDALGLGTDLFLTKPVDRDHLLITLRASIDRFRKLRALMAYDSLTQLYNHTSFKEQLSSQLALAARQEHPLALIMIDIDLFKQVNDTWGHPVGDQVLRGVSQLLKGRLRRSDVIGRYGGDEFAILMPNTDAGQAAVAIEELRHQCARLTYNNDGHPFSVTLSCGVASYPHLADEAALTRAADQALYRAKALGKNRVVIAEGSE